MREIVSDGLLGRLYGGLFFLTPCAAVLVCYLAPLTGPSGADGLRYLPADFWPPFRAALLSIAAFWPASLALQARRRR